jgi:hypothetical protein
MTRRCNFRYVDRDKNEENKGGTIEISNHCRRLFTRNAVFDSRAGTDEGSGD